ncbi:unnamed protein product [Oikopleura dioica]|uniref:Sulfatase N-terminal domain-containing protein n=2 Tax=Oikopleura dioica TaxID=34765 RepID=E4Z2R0_OIKDI|nr:unnamed protein product [Oikopleura dioica]
MKIFSNFLFFSNLAESKNRRPNVIILNTDDFGIGDFQIYNREAKVPTPNIDRLGHEGVKFLSAHSGSSRCSPSRYMLMTGRYSMDDSPARDLRPDEPNLAEMFKKSGYKTGLFGKNNPLASMVINKNATDADNTHSKRLDEEFEQKMHKLGKHYKSLHPANFLPGNYEQKTKPSKYGYDYSFTNTFACCQPAGFYENGKGIEPVDTWLRQLPYPENLPKDTPIFNSEKGSCSSFPYTGYMGPDRYSEKYTGDPLDLSIYFCNFAIQQIAMKSYDSRHSEEMVVPKLENFIDENAEKEFFVYYGLRSGHGPFNTPIRFRNQTSVGMLGEMIKEADEIVGRVLGKLESNGIADDTLVIFMSDNGPSSSSSNILEKFGHNQKQLDLEDETIELAGGKGGQGEAGHRTPFLWRYPSRFAPRSIYDPTVPVSTVDIYATLAELIKYDLDCNEAPDSRSLVHYLDTGRPNAELEDKPILTHAPKTGANASIRKKNAKYVPGTKELYNLSSDPETKNNLYNKKEFQGMISYLDTFLKDWLQYLDEREITTKNGSKKNSCFPQFERFKN